MRSRCVIFTMGVAVCLVAACDLSAADFRFERDTFAFQNATVLKYKDGRATKSRNTDPSNQYMRSCFVMTRSAMQFRKFARFQPRGVRLDEKELAARIRDVAGREPWQPALPANQRIVFPGYANLRAISKAHKRVFQENLGNGFATYFRPGNFRMFYEHSPEYQEKTHANLVAALARGDLFVGYLSTYPELSINHAVLVYARKRVHRRDKAEHYLVYDPNHAEAPRALTWSPREHAFSYQKDIDFVGGFTRVYQVYGKWLQ